MATSKPKTLAWCRYHF